MCRTLECDADEEQRDEEIYVTVSFTTCTISVVMGGYGKDQGALSEKPEIDIQF
jgi:hypothetical protein